MRLNSSETNLFTEAGAGAKVNITDTQRSQMQNTRQDEANVRKVKAVFLQLHIPHRREHHFAPTHNASGTRHDQASRGGTERKRT